MIEDKEMMHSARVGLAIPLSCAALIFAPLLAPSPALAQAAAPEKAAPPKAAAVPADAPPPTAEERANIKKKAAAAYKRGRDLIAEKGACDARGSVADTTEALHAFLDSLRLMPKPGTTFLAAVCHQALDHIEESLGLYEAYLSIPGIPDDLKVEAQKALVALRARVGTIVIEEAERGATLVVDGRARGEIPALPSVVATAGKHLVQVYLAGFTPFETTVGVLPGEVTKVSARLTALPKLGQLEVKERDGKTVDVVLDGTIVGRTPWQGQLGEGEHGVVLRGEKHVGSAPTTVTIAGAKAASLVLAAERLDATLRIVPEPSGATVLIDNTFVGRGAFEGHLRPGEHTIKVVADGFRAATKTVSVGAGAEETVRLVLDREAAAPVWQKPVDVVPARAAASGPPAWAWVIGGAGIVALGTAAAFGIDGLMTAKNLDNLCNGNLAKCAVPNQGQADAIALVNAHKNRDLGLFIGFATAGAVGVGVGLGRVLSSPKAPSKSAGSLVLSPLAGPGLGGAALGGQF
ncbi:Hypothetical protein A7982_04667 [Minicystis rosea]|nr:Hypothetical protein A7982_04667 [Minicystis rosea]